VFALLFRQAEIAFANKASVELQEEQPQFCQTLLTHVSAADQTALLEVCQRADTQEMMGLQSPFPISGSRGPTANGTS
jgi:hypothetical protein